MASAPLRLHHMPRLIGLAWVLGGSGCTTAVGGCDGISDPNARVECRLDALRPIADDYGQLELRLAEIEDPAEHDLVALRLMVQTPSLLPILCPRIRTSAARERCERLQERPHLSERARRPDGAPPP